MPIGLDPEQTCEFENLGQKCVSRFLTMRQIGRLTAKLGEAVKDPTRSGTYAKLQECLEMGMVSINGLPATMEQLGDLTDLEAFDFFYAWPGLVSEVESKLKKSSPSSGSSDGQAKAESVAPAAAAAA